MINIKKDEYPELEHPYDKRSRIEAIKYPERNGSDEIFDNELCEFVKLPTEQHKRIKYGFYQANIYSLLRPKAVKLYDIILFNTDKWQKTYIGNDKLSKYSGLSIEDISKRSNSLLNELEYYHLIHRHYTPHSRDKRKSRCIIIHRWDKAFELLKRDKRIITDENGNITSIVEPFLDYLKRTKNK
ncbi:hypothetical protein KO361_03145 [Candidatus Woesearchaeota archaeon]|jgi:hypothetical protein|nr:hypothetical protein [Candidatus Woesearchaeota archaeon]